MSQLSAIVIGSGVAGLASAIRLAVQGIQVTVLEKNDYPGGKLSHFGLNGFSFDAGPSLFTQPQQIEALFQLAGEPIGDYFSYRSLPVACHYFYEDGTRLIAYADADLFAQELSLKTGEDPGLVRRYLQHSKDLYRDVGSIFLNYSLHRFSSFSKAPIAKALRTVRSKYLFRSLHAVNTSAFTKPHTVQLFNRFATYNGSNPYKAPGMLSLIPHLEHNEGTFYPTGGMISITNALYRLALKKGVVFRFNTAAERILHAKGKVYAVLAGGQEIPADIVVSNMDVYGTCRFLLQDERKAAKVLRQERSSSALVFYWGINRVFDELNLHNIFFSADYAAEFDYIFNRKQLYADPTVYINITGKCEPGIQAPAGKENWFVMVNAPANTGQDWATLKTQCRAAVISKLSRLLQTDIASCIEVEESLDPVTIESKTASFMGSLYGTSSNSKMAAFLRQPNFSRSLKGLYFAGGSVHPGGGIPLCLKSAEIMSGLVAEDYGL